jgi:hypothetical protein
MSTTPQNGAELLARIKPVLATESCQIVLRPDLIKAWEQAQEALQKAQSEEVVREARMADRAEPSANVKKLAKKVKDLEAEIEAHAVTFTFRALPRDEWRALCEKHPPRKGNNVDHFLGHDRDAVEDAAVRVCMTDPVFDDASWGEFLAVCNPSEWNELKETVRSVNGSVTDLPKSQLASQVLAKRGSASRQPARGA